MTNYDDPRNINRRVFTTRVTIQGNDCREDEWEVASQADLDEFRAEVLARFTEHLDSCLSNGRWAFAVESMD